MSGARDLVTPLACAVALLGSAGGVALAPERAWEPREAPAPARPSRIVSLAVPADEILLAVIAPQRILAIDEFADDPRASNAVDAARAVQGRLPQPIAAESILALAPDLVILPAWSDPPIGALLAHQGVPVHRVGSPSSLEAVRAEIRALGDVVGARDRAEARVAEMDARLDAVRARGEARRARPGVMLLLWSGLTPGRGTLFCEVVELAGARCAAADAGLEGFAPIPVERVLELDPDVIAIDRYRANARARTVVPEGSIADDPRYRSLRAVGAGRVVDLPSAHLLATSHHVAALAEDLADALDALEARADGRAPSDRPTRAGAPRGADREAP